ncbi:hypothetical protein EON65_40170 [archaeon]|nr:MAG: hypothetical protein EON65_40170 [archaeon]
MMRSLRYTIDSYNRFVLEPIVAMNHTYEVFVHTYKLRHAYSNVRNFESPVWINETDWKMLKPNYIYVEEQDQFDNDVNYPIYQTKGDPWTNYYVSFKNHMRALNSLHHVTMALDSLCLSRQHASPKGTKCFDAVVFVRPDVDFLNSLPVHLLHEISPNLLYLPDFHRSCRRGEYNDRMAMGGLTAALTYGKRLQYALTYAQRHKLHAEGLTYDYLQEFKELEIVEIPFRFRRIRSSGATHGRDQEEVHAPYILQRNAYMCTHPYSFFAWVMSVGRTFYILLSQVYDTVITWTGSCKPNRYMTPNDVYLLDPNHCAHVEHDSLSLSQAHRKVECESKHMHMCMHDHDYASCSVLLVPHSCRYSLYSS